MVGSIGANGFALGAVADFGAKNCQVTTKADARHNVELITKTAIEPNACYALVAVEFDCTNMIDEKTFHDEFNCDPMAAYKFISDNFKDSPLNFSEDDRIVKVELLGS